MASKIKGHILEKRYRPAKPGDGTVELGRGEDEFQLLIEQPGAEPVWVSVTDAQYNAAQPGSTFTSGRQRKSFWFRGLHDSPAVANPATGAGEGWGAANSRF